MGNRAGSTGSASQLGQLEDPAGRGCRGRVAVRRASGISGRRDGRGARRRSHTGIQQQHGRTRLCRTANGTAPTVSSCIIAIIPGGAGRPPLLCLHGLTRNARDFDAAGRAVRRRLAGDRSRDARARRQRICARRVQLSACRTMSTTSLRCCASSMCGPVAIIGTSLGGLMAMLIAQRGRPGRSPAAVLNDIGPVLEPAGLERIRDYVGQGAQFRDLDARRARAAREQAPRRIPTTTCRDWLAFAKRVMVHQQQRPHRVRLRHEDRRAVRQRGSTASMLDLWPAFRALAGKPLLVVRGELSDLLSAGHARHGCRPRCRAPGR